jgi:hypothetical protein
MRGLRSELRNWFDVDLVPNTVGTRSGIAKPTDNDRIAQDKKSGPAPPRSVLAPTASGRPQSAVQPRVHGGRAASGGAASGGRLHVLQTLD